MKILVLGDLHCRLFWREAVESWDDYIIFLGDYIDPYPYEFEKEPNPIDTLLDVLNFKDRNQDRVTLLLGNHKLSNFFWKSLK